MDFYKAQGFNVCWKIMPLECSESNADTRYLSVVKASLDACESLLEIFYDNLSNIIKERDSIKPYSLFQVGCF